MELFNLLKNKRCHVYLPVPYNWPSLSKDHQTVTMMNHCCYSFDGLWKVKIKYKVLCLNALAKLQNARGAFRHPALMGNYLTCSHVPWLHQSTKWFVISPSQVVYAELPVNVLNNLTRRLYVLIMPHERCRLNLDSVVAWMSRTPCSKQTRYLEFKWMRRDSNPQSLLS